MTTPRRWTVAGVAAAGVGAGLLFKWSVVDPAYTPLPNGHYGELYGPVSFLRFPVYVLYGCLVAAGVTCAGVSLRHEVRNHGIHSPRE